MTEHPAAATGRRSLRRIVAGLLLVLLAVGIGLAVEASLSIARLSADIEAARLEASSFSAADRELLRLSEALLRLADGQDLPAVETHRDLALQQMRVLGGGQQGDDPLPAVAAIAAEVAALDWDSVAGALDGGHAEITAAVAPLDAALFDIEGRFRQLQNRAEREFYESTALALDSKAQSERALMLLILSTVVASGGCILVIRRRSRRNVVSARSALRATEERFISLVQNSSDILMVLDATGVITYCSPAYVATLNEAAPVGRHYADLVPQGERGRVDALLAALTDDAGGSRRLQHRLIQGGRHVESVWHNHLANPAVEGIVVNMRDVSERQALESQLRHQALRDPLTALANRTLLDERVARAVALAGTRPQTFALLLLDLDGFKRVNDGLGHSVGDELLVAVAERLLRCTTDTETVARLGGDEFVILTDHLRDGAQATELAARVVASIAEPFQIGAHSISSSASVGVYVATAQEVAGEDLLRNADLAMYHAKREGKGRYILFEEGMRRAARARLELEMDLRAALAAGDVYPDYQPIFDIPSGRIVGVEALARWRHPERGLVPPSEFIPVAEESNLIIELGSYMLDAALAQLKKWSRYGDFYMSINVAPRQLRTPGFNAHLTGALADSHIDPSRVMLEITEETLMEEQESMVDQLKALRARGVRLAIDDFGTGYSSLAYLKRLPIDVLKIDRAFSQAVDTGPENAALAQAIVHVASSLGLATIAEGIETAAQASHLSAMGCTTAQGYYFARPLDAEHLEALLNAQPPPSLPSPRRGRQLLDAL